ncbi:MAG: hypothetical protein AAFP98_03605 [Pseudomonadota bacterium]
MIVWLSRCADQSRALLIAGLCLGIGVPALASALGAWLPQMVAILLIITTFRIGARDAFGALRDLRWSLPAVLVLQIGLPLLLASIMWLLGALQTPLALALVLAASAPTISGGASLAIIMGQNPARIMQILVLGTAAFPLTVLVVLQCVPLLGDTTGLVEVGVRSLATIVGSAAIGFALRRTLLPNPSTAQIKAIDGAAILFFAIIVIGLMTALGPTLRSAPMTALLWAIAAFGLCFGAQALAVLILAQGPLARVAGPLALAAGNRNIALFLVALPPDVMAPIMVFVACWQLPMYLTPMFLKGLYSRTLSYD